LLAFLEKFLGDNRFQRHFISEFVYFERFFAIFANSWVCWYPLAKTDVFRKRVRDGDCGQNERFWFFLEKMNNTRIYVSLHRIHAKYAEKCRKIKKIKKKVEIFFYICYIIIEEL